MKKYMCDFYHKNSFVNLYIVGFRFSGKIYTVIVTFPELIPAIKIEQGSKNSGYRLRFRPNLAWKMSMLNRAKIECSENFFESIRINRNYGDTYEKMIVEQAGFIWARNTDKFNEAPDVTINNVDYQIKFEKATFTDEKTINNIKRGF